MTNRPHGRQETGSTASASDLQGGHATPDAKTTLSRRDFGVLLLGLGAAAQMGFPATEAEAAEPLVFAIIGDYGWQQQPNEAAVAALVKSWNPQFIVTNGDNNYGEGDAAQQDATQGSAATIDKNIGQYYHDFIYPYNGAYGPSADINRFFPILADKDWNPVTGYQAHLDYFTLPGNERYYDFVWGPVHFFMLNSDTHEPDSPFLGGPQSTWLQQRLAASTAPWKLVHLHNPPYSSNTPFTRSQWPFADWGANVVSSGQAHVYERIHRDGIVYFINGLGGRSRGTFDDTPDPASAFRFGAAFGAQRVTVTPDRITFEFFSIEGGGTLIDSFTLTKNTPSAPIKLTATASSPTQVQLVWEDVSGIEGGYSVERSTDGSQFAEIASLPANTTAYADTTAAPGTQYYYQVRAFQGTVFSGYSNVANATTPAGPGAPTQLTATAVSPTQVELAWKDNTSNEDGFKVERSTDGINFTEIASLAANTTTYAETVAAPATQYHYRVRAFLGTLFSEYSNVAQVPNNAPVVNAGPDQNLKTTTDLLTTVNLSGSGADVDGDPLSFQWIFEGNVIATGTQATVQLPFGNHTVILAARDPRGAVGMDTVQIRIPLPPSTNDAKITGSGTVPAPGGTGSFSVSAQYKNGKHSGSASWSGPNGVEVTGTEIAGVYVNGTRGEVYGVGRLKDGTLVRFRMDVDDQGNPGKNDQLTLTLTNGYSAGGKLSGGNVKIH